MRARVSASAAAGFCIIFTTLLGACAEPVEIAALPDECSLIVRQSGDLPSGHVEHAYNASLGAMRVNDNIRETGNATLLSSELDPASGPLPAGLSLAGDSLVGAATEEGTFTFTVVFKGTCDPNAPPEEPGAVISRDYTVTIGPPCGAPVVAHTSELTLPPGSVEGQYSPFFFTPEVGEENITWSLGGEGRLPLGMALSPTGELSGSPLESGNFFFDIVASNGCLSPNGVFEQRDVLTGPTTVMRCYLSICGGLGLSSQVQPSDGVLGEPYSFTPEINGGTAPYNIQIVDGFGRLPEGLTLDSSTGLIEGTPDERGSYTVKLDVVDSCPSGPQVGELNFTFHIRATASDCGSLSLREQPVPPTAQVGSSYVFEPGLTASSPVTLEVLEGGDPLPPGLSISNDNIEGTPTDAGDYLVHLRASDSCNPSPLSSDVWYRFRVDLPSSCTLPTLDRTAPGDATVGQAYSYQPRAVPGIGTEPYTYQVIDAISSIPPGLSFTGTALEGTPTQAGTFSVFIEVSDSCVDGARTDGDFFVITVVGGAPTAVTEQSASMSVPQNLPIIKQLSASGGSTGTLNWRISRQAQSGTATIASGASGPASNPVTVRYQPNTGFIGSDEFAVEADNGQDVVERITVDVDVYQTTTPPPPPPPPPPTPPPPPGQPTPGASFYVNNTASNASDSNPGTASAPFKTIQRAVNAANAGSTILVAGGVYNEQVTINNKQAAATSPLTIKNYEGARPIVDGQNTRENGFVVENSRYVIIDGFEIRYTKRNGVFMSDMVAFCQVKNCLIHDMAGPGVYFRGSDDCSVSYCEAYHTYIGFQINWRDVTQDPCLRALISHNISHDNFTNIEDSDNIAGTGCTLAIVEYNICYNAADDGIDFSASGGKVDMPTNCTIRYNAVWNSGFKGQPGDGNGIKTSTNAGAGHIVHHNICFKNANNGMDNDQELNYGFNRFYNNTIYGNSKHGFGLDMAGITSFSSAAFAMNNLLAGNNTSNSGWKDYRANGANAINQSDYNFIGDGSFPTQEGSHSLTKGSVVNPNLANPNGTINVNYTGGGGLQSKWQFIWNQIQANFAPQSGSVCVNKGTVISGITGSFIGSAPDIGAIDK